MTKTVTCIKNNKDEINKINNERDCRIIMFISLLLMLIFSFIVFWSLFGWFFDNNKNIPVFIKYIKTSIIDEGTPNKETQDIWRQEFEKPNIKTWPYYALFGIFITSICIILQSFTNCFGICCGDSNCGNCGNCNCGNCNCGNCNCGNCGNCNIGSGSGGGGEICIFFLIILVIIIIAIILSAIFVVIGYAIKIISDYINVYDNMVQQYTLEQNNIIEICDRDDFSIENNAKNVSPLCEMV